MPTPSTDLPRCESCGKTWGEHASFRDTCAELQRVKAELRVAFSLLAHMEDHASNFHDAMTLIGKHCGVTVPPLPTESISLWEYFKQNPVCYPAKETKDAQ